MICSDLLNCFRSISTTTVIARENSKNSLKVIFTKKSSLKAAIFLCFDVFPLQPTQKFQVQAKISRIWPVFPDCLSVNYDYDWRYLDVCYSLTWIYENSERNPIKYLPRKVYHYLLFLDVSVKYYKFHIKTFYLSYRYVLRYAGAGIWPTDFKKLVSIIYMNPF